MTSYAAMQTYTYNGLDFSGALTGDDVEFGNALETLKAIFKVEETSGSYETKLTRRVYVSARYRLSEKLSVSGLFIMKTTGTSRFPLWLSASILHHSNSSMLA